MRRIARDPHRLDSPGGEIRQKTVGRTRLKTALTLAGSLGAFALVVPALTGVSLKQLAQGISLEAYSNFNLAYIRSTHALERGDLPAATESLLSLPEDSPESLQVAIVLFPRLLEAKDYRRAGQVMEYLKKPAPVPSVEFIVQGHDAGAMTPGELGKHMGANLGLQEALALIAEDPNLTALRLRILPSLFLAISAEEMPVLERLAGTSEGQEEVIVKEAIIFRHIQAKSWADAWKWVEKLPTHRQKIGQTYVMTEMARMDPQAALRFLRSRQGMPEFPNLFSAALEGIARERPQELKPLLQLVDTPEHRDKAIHRVLTQYSMPSLSELLALLEMQVDPEIRARTLVRINPTSDMRSKDVQQEFQLRTITPRLTALARQHPALSPLHDAYLISKIGESLVPQEHKERYLAQILDPALRASVKKDMATNSVYKNHQAQLRILGRTPVTRISPIAEAK